MKVKSTDLRIGNLISWRLGTGQIVTGFVKAIEADKVAISDKNEWFDEDEQRSKASQVYIKIDAVIPVYLTTDRLIEFGFKVTQRPDGYQGGQGWRLKKKHPKYPFGKDIEIYSTEGSFYYKGIDHVRIDYVHQQQNLYFALTYEELTAAKD